MRLVVLEAIRLSELMELLPVEPVGIVVGLISLQPIRIIAILDCLVAVMEAVLVERAPKMVMVIQEPPGYLRGPLAAAALGGIIKALPQIPEVPEVMVLQEMRRFSGNENFTSVKRSD